MPLALALDFGGTKVQAALIADDGQIIDASRSRASTGSNSTSDEVAHSVQHVIRHALGALSAGEEILGVGIGSAGPINDVTGTVSPLNVPAWRDYPLVDLVRREVGDVPVDLRIDGLCISLGDYWLGAAQGVATVMGMIVSTGVGGGLIINGRPTGGASGNAGHIGHVEVGGFDDPCLCGGRGCLEAIASGPNTVAWARRGGWTGHTGEDLARDYQAGHPVARAAVARAGRAIGSAIGSATNLLDLDLVVIGGGFSKVTPDLFDFIREGLAERNVFSFVQRTRVVPSAIADDAPLLGAAALVHRSAWLD